jgi:hypothetical protein
MVCPGGSSPSSIPQPLVETAPNYSDLFNKLMIAWRAGELAGMDWMKRVDELQSDVAANFKTEVSGGIVPRSAMAQGTSDGLL